MRSSPKDETPHRVNRVRPLVDHQVDRTQVEAGQLVELSVTNGRGLAPRSLTASNRQDPLSLRSTTCLFNLLTQEPRVWRPNGLGGESGVVPPVPIPNTEVKLLSADGSWDTRPCESRTLPGERQEFTFLSFSFPFWRIGKNFLL